MCSMPTSCRAICMRAWPSDHEQVHALDEKTYVLDNDTIVIADDACARGIAGIMGGMDTGSFEDTVNVFIESAFFDPARIARAGRKQGIISDARYRFERGVDPQFVLPGLELCTRLILEWCGGEASDVVIAGAVAAAAQADPVRCRHLSRSWAASACRAKRSSPFWKAWALWSRTTASCMSRRPAGAMTWTAPPTWWKKSSAFTAWAMCRRWRWRAPMAWPRPSCPGRSGAPAPRGGRWRCAASMNA